MITYAVELEMDAGLRDEYLAWLREHVAEMLTLPGFTGAEIMQRHEPPAAPGRAVIAAHYHLRDRAAFDRYLTEHAPRMRAAGLARFGDRVRAARQVLETA